MIPDTEKWYNFERSECWQKLLELVNKEMGRSIGDVRANARVSGKECETAYATGCADTFELVSKLPEKIKKQLAQKGEKHVDSK